MAKQAVHLTPREREVVDALARAEPTGLQAGMLALAVYACNDRPERHAIRLLLSRLRRKGVAIEREHLRAPYRLRPEQSTMENDPLADCSPIGQRA